MSVEEIFHRLADEIRERLQGDEVATVGFAGEDSDFVRLNGGAVRQAGSVEQRVLSLDLALGRRHASGELSLSGEPEIDVARAAELVRELREQRTALPEDPHFLLSTDAASCVRRQPDRLPDAQQVLEEVRATSRGQDLVGVYASGGIHRGFASSLGHRHWFTSHCYNLDWSVHAGSDRAVKASYAGFEWDADELARRAALVDEQLAALAQPARELRPGRYRTYLAPSAMAELFDILSWGGFGLEAHRTKQSPLVRMSEDGARLHASVSLTESAVRGIAPPFESAGFLRPDEVALVRAGDFADCLVSPRSAVEYGVPTNGASRSESPLSLEMAAGELARDRVPGELGTGLYVSNLWYLNFSDRSACRTTGMTRFATFWVEGGRIVAPVPAMRFDETVYRMLGEKLAGLTRERERILDPESYGARSTRSALLPGALIDDFTLTL